MSTTSRGIVWVLALSAAVTAVVVVAGVGRADAAVGATARSASVGSSAAGLATDGQSAYKLAAHNAGVRYDRDVRMWDCWALGARPRLSAWSGERWVRWSTGAVSRDRRKCGTTANKVVFSYRVTLLGRPVRGVVYNLVRVKEHCAGCQAAS